MEKCIMAKVHQGQLVAQHREYMGMSQQDLADEMKLSLRTVQRLEKDAVIEDKARREFLVGLLGIPSVLMGLEQGDVQPIKKARLTLNDDCMAFYERARALLDKSLVTYPLTMLPKRASLTAYKAEAYYGMGEIDICTTIAEEAWKLANSVGTKEAMGKVERLYATLEHSRWGKEKCVRRLGVVIATS